MHINGVYSLTFCPLDDSLDIRGGKTVSASLEENLHELSSARLIRQGYVQPFHEPVYNNRWDQTKPNRTESNRNEMKRKNVGLTIQ